MSPRTTRRHPLPANQPGVRFFYVCPPYRRRERISLGDMPTRLPIGSIALIEVERADAVCLLTLGESVRMLRRDHRMAVAVVVHEPNTPAGARVVYSAPSLGACAAIPPGGSIRECFVRQLPGADRLATQWIGALRLHCRVSGRAEASAAAIMSAATAELDREPMSRRLRRLSLKPRTIRAHMQAEALPRPCRWFTAARLFHAQLALQRDPELTIEAMAQRLGYAEAASFSNQIVRIFGTTAQKARRLLGTEWRVWEWWRRSKRNNHPSRQ